MHATQAHAGAAGGALNHLGRDSLRFPAGSGAQIREKLVVSGAQLRPRGMANIEKREQRNCTKDRNTKNWFPPPESQKRGSVKWQKSSLPVYSANFNGPEPGLVAVILEGDRAVLHGLAGEQRGGVRTGGPALLDSRPRGG